MKPAGIFTTRPGAPSVRPAWATFSGLADWEDFEAAAADSRATGIRWVLLLYGLPPNEPVEAHVARVAARIDAAGLRPHLVGIAYHEEWYGNWKGGRWPIAQLDHTNPRHWVAGAWPRGCSIGAPGRAR